MVKCTRCSGKGHEAADCPSPPAKSLAASAPVPTRKRKASAEPDTESDEDSPRPSDEDDSEAATASEASSVASCGICEADRNKKCKDGSCDAAADRLERFETRKRILKSGKKAKTQPPAAAAAGTAVAAGAAVSTVRAVPAPQGPSADDILKYTKVAEFAALTPAQTVEVPEVFYAVLHAKHKDLRNRYHQKYFDAVEAKAQLNLPPSGQVTAFDIARADWLLDALKLLTEPSEDGSITVDLLKKRISHFVTIAAREVLSVRDAREEGWGIVRDALSIHRSEVGQPKAWREALIKARARARGRPSGGTGHSPRGDGRKLGDGKPNPRRGFRTRGRGGAASGAGGKDGKKG